MEWLFQTENLRLRQDRESERLFKKKKKKDSERRETKWKLGDAAAMWKLGDVKVRRCSSCKDVGYTRRTCPSAHIQQGEHADGDNVPESMEHLVVGSPDLETNYYNFL